MDTEIALPAANEQGDGDIYRMEIAIERTADDSGDHGPPLDLTQIWISHNGVTRFLLAKPSSRRWEMRGFIKLSDEARSIHCTVKCGNGEDLPSVRLDCDAMRTTDAGVEHVSRKRMEVHDSRLDLAVLWKLTIHRGDALHCMKAKCAANASIQSFSQTGSPDSLNEVVEELRRAVDCCPTWHCETWADLLPNLARFLRCRFKLRGSVHDIDEAISVQQMLIGLIPAVPKIQGLWHSGLAVLLWDRFGRAGVLGDITEAISAMRAAMLLLPRGDALLPRSLNILGILLGCLSERTGYLPDISEAIDIYQKAVEVTTVGHPDLPDMLTDLGNSFQHRFLYTAANVDIEEAISAFRAAVEATPTDHPDLPDRLHNLGSILMEHFQRTGHLHVIDEAITVYQKAVGVFAVGHPDLPDRLTNLGISFQRRFLYTAANVDIEAAISAFRAAVEATPTDHPDLPDRLHNLGSILMEHFQRTGRRSNSDESINIHRRAVRLTEPGHTSFPFTLNGLATSLAQSSRHTGNLPDLEEGMLLVQKAVQMTPEGNKELPVYLFNLGMLLLRRFEYTCDVSNTSEAISVLQRALEAYQDSDRITYPDLLLGLASAFSTRWESTGDLLDIDEAISTSRKALDSTRHGHPASRHRLVALGTHLISRWSESGQSVDLHESISVHEAAMELIPEGDPHLPTLLSNLGQSLSMRFKVAGDAMDLTKGISHLERAVRLTPAGHAALPGYLLYLGIIRRTRFYATRSSMNRDSLLDTPQSVQLQFLGDMRECMDAFEAATKSGVSKPRVRLNAALMWAECINSWYPQSPNVLVALGTALNLLTLVASVEQTIRTRHIQLQDNTNTALQVASMACSLERPDKALEWLEQGRCLVWRQIHNLRTPLDGLRRHNGNLAQRIMDVSRQLENAGSSREHARMDMPLHQKISLQEEASAHANLAKRWEELLNEVRAIPGFESFLQPVQCATLLQNLPEAGPILIINVHKDRCDAIALRAGFNEPLHIPLPNFSEQKAKEYQRILKLQLQSRQLRMRGECIEADSGRAMGRYRDKRGINNAPIRTVLRGLWTDIVKPILDILAISKLEPLHDKDPPRIWWCPTGVLSFLPLHAAGVYDPGVEPESVLDYVVSSYTPTVSALTKRVRDDRPIDSNVSGLFLTSQPNAPGTRAIPGTTMEVCSIHAKAIVNGIRAFKAEGNSLTVDDCLNHLENFSSIHLACHGYQNAEESLQSRFYFHNGTLDLAAILRKDLKNADLAFLSACLTATGDENLSDEAVHLAAGMLAAGYRRVVASMWCIQDKAAEVVANNFYDWLFSHREVESGSGFDGSLSAYALHHAIQKLREEKGDTDDAILAWAPFIHFGY